MAMRTHHASVTIAATENAVFDALTDGLAHWFAEHVEITFDRIRFWGHTTIHGPETPIEPQPFSAEPPRSVSFKWRWAEQLTRVTFTLARLGDDIRVVLEHDFTEPLTDERGWGSRGDFWTTALGNLRCYVETGAPALLPMVLADGARDVVEQSITIDASARRIYETMMNPALVDQWIGTGAEIEPRVGGAYDYGWRDDGERVGPRTLRALERDRFVETDWHHGPMEGDAFVRWTIDPIDDARSRVAIEHRGFIRPEDHADHVLGWAAYMMRLKRIAEGRRP